MAKHAKTVDLFKRPRYVAMISDDDDDDDDEIPVVNTPPRSMQRIHERNDTNTTSIADEDASVADEDAAVADEDAAVADEDAAVADEDAAVADEDAAAAIDEDADDAVVVDEDADDAVVIDAASSIPTESYPLPEIDAHSLGMIMSKLEDRPGVFSSRTLMRLMNTSKFFRYACSSLIITRMDCKSTQSLITVNELLPELLQRVTHISLYRANRVTEIASILELGMRLKVLNISHTKVTSIGALATLPELEELYCSNTHITTLMDFHMNETLKLLDVSGCRRLDTGVAFPIFMALEILDLSNNEYAISLDMWNCGDIGIDPLPSLKMWRGSMPVNLPLNDTQRKLEQLHIT